MFDFLANNQLFIVMTIILLIWVGIVFYLFRLDRKVKQLEQSMKKG
ncbi:MAG TPA: CcmD family protein [Bacteroidota bacterium]|nr:CcmD family protein [Bacteroidota bacterium]